MDTSQIAQPAALNRNSVNRYLHVIRKRIAEFYETQSPFSGEIEINKSFLGARRIKGKRGRGAPAKLSSSISQTQRQGLHENRSRFAPKPPCKGHPGQEHSRYGAGTMGLLTWGMENIFRIDHKQCELRFN